MYILDRYILFSLLRMWSGISITLILLAWLIRFMNTMNLVTSSGESLMTVFRITIFVIPEIAFTILPLSLPIAVIITLTKLNSDSELSILSAAGVSPVRLFRPFLFCFILASLLVGFMGVWLQPKTLALYRIEKTFAGTNLISQLLEPGAFANLRGELIFHFKDVDKNGNLMGIIAQLYSDGNRNTYHAKQGAIVRDGDEIKLILLEGTILPDPFSKENQNDPILSFGRYNLPLTEFITSNRTVNFKIREYTNQELLDIIKTHQDERHVQRVKAEMHMRISSFFFVFSFGLLAFTINMASRTTRQNRISQIALAMAVILIARILSLNFISAANKDPSAIALIYISALLPIILCILEILEVVPIGKWLSILFSPLTKLFSFITNKLFNRFESFLKSVKTRKSKSHNVLENERDYNK